MGKDALTIVQHPVIADRVRQIRDVSTGTTQFRSALRDIGLFLTYHVLSNAASEACQIKTPLMTMTAHRLKSDNIKLIGILRAGLGLLDGARAVIPEAGVGHIGFRRDESTLIAHHYYTSLPDITSNNHLLVFDPMIATGGSSAAALEILYKTKAQKITLICALCAPEGIANLEKQFPDIQIVTSAQDSHLNQDGYIVPGLGDAGDRLFAT